MKQKIVVVTALACSALVGALLGSHRAVASDHDDGSQATANKNTNLTDLLVYREQDQNPSITTNDLVFQMNLNPFSMKQTDYAFSPNARYDFHITRVGTAADNAKTPTGLEDVLLRYTFAAPDATSHQAITLSLTHDGTTVSAPAGTTSAYADGAAPTINAVNVGGQQAVVFAGLREDTFFFDVDQFLQVRSTALARAAGNTTTAQATFKNPGVDFTAGYNVLSIIARIPREMLQSAAAETTFDVWETISAQQ